MCRVRKWASRTECAGGWIGCAPVNRMVACLSIAPHDCTSRWAAEVLCGRNVHHDRIVVRAHGCRTGMRTGYGSFCSNFVGLRVFLYCFTIERAANVANKSVSILRLDSVQCSNLIYPYSG